MKISNTLSLVLILFVVVANAQQLRVPSIFSSNMVFYPLLNPPLGNQERFSSPLPTAHPFRQATYL
jgi:hypothetical protein